MSRIWKYYADDTFLFSTSEQDVDYALEMFKDYRNTWKLSVNVSKTKVIIYNSGKNHFSLV